MFSPFFTFLIFVYVRGPSALNATEAFTTLALIALITTPIQLLVNAVSQFGVGLGCFDRIQAYLLLPEDQSSSFKTTLSSQQGPASSIQYSSEISIQPEHEIPLRDMPSREAEETSSVILEMGGQTFFYPGSAKPALQNIDLCISSGSLTMIVGPTGSGKTTLLKAIISFCSREQSSQKLPISIAYCSQEPWLPNTTFQNIILASSDMDHDWYRSVLQACDLEKDLLAMPLSDLTIVGTRGTSLSGGQRQRLGELIFR